MMAPLFRVISDEYLLPWLMLANALRPSVRKRRRAWLQAYRSLEIR